LTILQQLDHRFRYSADLACGNKRPTYAITDDFPCTTHICGDYRTSASRCFNQSHWQSFSVGRKERYVTGAGDIHSFPLVVDSSCEHDSMMQSRSLYLPSQRRPFRAVADNNQSSFR
jgi:hypothetical protein